MKIKKLTPEQEVDLPIFRKHYLDIAIGGGRIERDKLQDAMNDAYAIIGKPAPALFIFDSPQECMLAIKMVQMKNENLWQNLWQNLEQNLEQNLWQNLRENLRENLSQNLRENLRENLEQNLWQNLRQNLSQNLSQNLWQNLEQNLSQNLLQNLCYNLWQEKIWNPSFLWGSQDLYWIAYYRFAQKIGCIFAEQDAQRLDTMEAISSQCEWWWPFEGIVFASQRPIATKWADGMLHCENGLAVEYADGYGIAMYRGQLIPNDWVQGKLPTSIEALRWPNIDQRQAACELVGWDNIVHPDNGAVMIDKGKNMMIGELWEMPLSDSGLQRFIRATCGTGRTAVVLTDNKYDTALEANAASYGMPPALFEQIEIRT